MITSRVVIRWLAIVCLVIGLGRFLWPWLAGPRPPVVKLDGADPAVTAAISNARWAVRWTPRAAPAWGRLGMVLAAHDFHSEAIVCLAQAERLDPRELRWAYFQGLSLLDENPEAAIPHLQRAVELCADASLAPRLWLGRTRRRQGRLDEAEAQIRKILDRDQNYAPAVLDLGTIELARGRLQESVGLLNRSRADKRTEKSSELLLATAYQRLGDPSAAAAASRRAASLPDDLVIDDPYAKEVSGMRVGLDAAIQQADALARKGSPTEALALMENAARDYPNNARAWLVLGRARARVHTNDLAGAEAALRTAVKLAPQSFENRVELGLALFGEKKFSDAAKCFRAVIQIKPDLASAYYNLALCLVQLHENAEALVHAHHAVRLDPADTRARSLVEKLQQPRAAISAKP